MLFLLIGIGAFIAFAYIQIFLPGKLTQEKVTRMENNPKADRFPKWENRQGWFFLLLLGGLVPALFFGLSAVLPSGAIQEETTLILYPDPWYAWIPATLFAIAGGAALAEWLTKILLKGNFQDYETYARLKHGPSRKLGILASGLVAMAGVVTVGLSSDWEIQFGPDQLQYNAYFSYRTTQTVDYSNIRKIERLDIGGKNGANGYRITLVLEDDHIELPEFAPLNEILLSLAEEHAIEVETRKPS